MKKPYPCKCAFCAEEILDEFEYIAHVYIEHPEENADICKNMEALEEAVEKKRELHEKA